jgi:lysozyme
MASYTPGIDVSRYEGDINWKKVAAAGYRFAVIRATVGDYYTDPRFYSYWTDAKSAGLLVTAYHVVVATNYAEKQISRFFSVLGDRKSDFPYVLDIERDDNVSNSANTACVQDCIREIASHDSRRPIIYTAYYYWKDHIQSSSDWAKYDLWVASYNSTPTIPPGWSNWKFWQYSEGGKVDGISGSVDLDWFHGSYDDFKAYAAGKSTSSSSSTEPASNLNATVLSTTLNIRSGPGISYKNIGTLVKGKTVNIINVGGTDAWIQYESGKWAACYSGSSQYIEIQSAVKDGDVLKAKILVDQLNIRSGAGTSYSSLGKLKKGDIVTVIGLGGRDIWVQIELGKWVAFTYGGIKYLELNK